MALTKRKPFHTKQRTRRIFWKRVTYAGTSFLVLSCLVLFVFYGTRLPGMTLDTVVVEGVETVSRERVEERTNTLLAGSYFGIVPHRFSYLLPLERIRAVIEEMPRVAKAEVTRQGASLIVSIVEHAPEMLWCSGFPSGDCFYVDEEGVAYEKAPDLTGGMLLRFAVAGHDPKEGDSLLSSEVRTKLIAVAKAMEERHDFRVAKIEYSPDGDATLALSGGGIVQVSTQNDLEETYANLASILASEEFAHLTPGNFERIDLRFGNKVFVQEEPFVASSTATTTSEVE